MKKLTAGILSPIALATAMSAGLATVPMAAQAELSGNIGIHSEYLLRGIAEENEDTAVQGGLDYSNDSGFYAGWWFSNLGYEYDEDGAVFDDNGNGFEHDFYAGFSGDFGDSGFGWSIGFIQYVYMEVDDSDLTELDASVSYGGGYARMQYLLNDGWWGNDGDIYWTFGYGFDLPKDFTLDLQLGYYTYDDDDNSELCNPDPSDCGVTTKDDAFRHFTATVSHPVGDTGADMYASFVLPGDDRAGNDDYDNKVIVGLTYGFDI